MPRIFDNIEKSLLPALKETLAISERSDFRIGQSKPTIDEIDTVLARHCGFTPDELDFILNYDIKYRLGGTAEAGTGD